MAFQLSIFSSGEAKHHSGFHGAWRFNVRYCRWKKRKLSSCSTLQSIHRHLLLETQDRDQVDVIADLEGDQKMIFAKTFFFPALACEGVDQLQAAVG
jgi:hypothetical protein